MKRSNKRHTMFLTALVIIFFTSTVYYSIKAEKYSQYIQHADERAMSQLVSDLSEINTGLGKIRYASTSRTFQTISANLWKTAEHARSVISTLSLQDGELDQTKKFISQTGDFAYYMLFASAGDEPISPENLDAIDSLYYTSEVVTREISSAKGQLNSGQIALSGITEDANVGTNVKMSDSFSGIEQEFPEYATLIYDGPFSEHLSYSKPKMLECLDEVTLEQAIKNASSFGGVSVGDISLIYEGGDRIKSYCLSAKNGATMEVSKQGGIIFTYKHNREVKNTLLSAEQAIAKAYTFLSERNFKNMRESYYMIYDGIITINFAYCENDIIVYGDLIKVSVALDDGEVIGMEAKGYLMSHTNRSLDRPAVSAEKALGQISPKLTVNSINLALIPTSGENEVLCHEYVCVDKDGMHIIVYVNVATGQEQNIYMLIEDENGYLTI